MVLKRYVFPVMTLLLVSLSVPAQERKGEFSGYLKTRYIGTTNRGDLKDFSVLVLNSKFKYTYRPASWLTLGGAVYGAFDFGISDITARDAITNSGTRYEGNLLNKADLESDLEGFLGEIYAEVQWGQHKVRLGRFLENTPLLNPEGWAFPNALQGVWYKRDADKYGLQLAVLNQIAPRHSARFEKIGKTLGRAGVGIGPDGSASGYRGNTESDYLVALNASWDISDRLHFNAWNYYVDNLFNTLHIEPSWQLTKDSDQWVLTGQYIHQDRVGDGGNPDPSLRYFTDRSSNTYGLKLAYKRKGKTLSLQYTRITDTGRMLIPREWSREPYFTFQRRTRIEGNRDVDALVFKWDQQWMTETSDWRILASAGQHWRPDPGDAEANKYKVPASPHVNVTLYYKNKSKLKGLGVEWMISGRWLSDEIDGNQSYLINRADFFHTDFLISYTFRSVKER